VAGVDAKKGNAITVAKKGQESSPAASFREHNKKHNQKRGVTVQAGVTLVLERDAENAPVGKTNVPGEEGDRGRTWPVET